MLTEDRIRSGWETPETAPIDGEFDAEVIIDGGTVCKARWGLHNYPGIGKGRCWKTASGDLFGLYEVLGWRSLRH